MKKPLLNTTVKLSSDSLSESEKAWLNDSSENAFFKKMDRLRGVVKPEQDPKEDSDTKDSSK